MPQLVMSWAKSAKARPKTPWRASFMFMTFLIEKTTKEGIGKTKSLPLFKFEAMGIERDNT